MTDTEADGIEGRYRQGRRGVEGMIYDIESEMANLERAFERGDIDDKKYDEEMDALMRFANEASERLRA